MIRARAKFLLTISTTAILLMSWLMLLSTFLSAYLSPTKTAIVHINRVGEANIELVFLLLTIPCIAIYLSNLGWNERDFTVWFDELERKQR